MAGVWYYLDYIPRNEQELDEQHFRWLQKVDVNIRAKIVANDTLLANLLQAYIQADITGTSKKVSKYIDQYSKNIDGSLTYNIEPDTTAKHIAFKNTIQPTLKPDTCSIQFTLSWDSAMNKLTLSASKLRKDAALRYIIQLKYNFENFINPLLIPNLFTHYVVFYEGNYIYEDFHSGLGYTNKEEDSLLKTGKGMTGANIIKQKVGGVDYQIFFQPINFFTGKKLIIAGLLSQQKIDTEKKQLPAGIAVLSISIALGILLFLPWIKIYFQGKYDKINLRDAAESVLVTKLMMSLIVLLFFSYNSSFRRCNEDSKKVLADCIESAFNREIDSAYICLNRFDSIMKIDSMFYDVINLGKDNIKFVRNENIFNKDSYKDSLQKDTGLFKNIGKSLQYVELHWLDSTGRLKYGWTISDQNNLHSYYNDRDYFKRFLNGNNISLKIKPEDPIYIDQLISRTSGTFRTIISKKSCLNSFKLKQDRARIVTLSLVINSLDSIIMPAGYSFAIINDNGDVKYHSNSERNLNENLLEEFSNSEQLHDALQGRFEKTFKAKYYESEDSVLVRPIQGMPFFIVIMNDQRFTDDAQIKSFSFTWGMVIIFLLVVMLDLFVLIYASSRRSLFKKQFIVTNWLWPRADSRKEYRIAAIGNCILLVIQICCFHFFNYLSYLFILLYSIPLSTIFINSLFLHKYKIEKNKTYISYKVRCNRFSILLLVIINFFAFILLGSVYWHVLIFEVLAIITGFLLVRFHTRLYIFYQLYIRLKRYIYARPHKVNGISEDNMHVKKGYINSYTCMVFTRLLITSALPVIFFYTTSYNFENNLLARYRQYDFVKQLQQKFPGKLLPDNSLHYDDGIYTDNTWIKSVDTITERGYDSIVNKKPLSTSEKNTAALFNYFGVYISDVSSVTDNFYRSFSDDTSYNFNNFFKNVLRKKDGNVLLINRKAYATETAEDSSSTYLNVTSKNLNYSFPYIRHNGFMFWLLFAVAMFIFYIILREVIKKVCSLNIDFIPLLKHTDNTFKQLLNNTDKSLIWVNGILNDEIQDKIEKQIGANNSIPVLDFNNIETNNKKPDGITLEKVNDKNYLFTVIPAEEKESAWNKTKSDALSNSSTFVILLNIESNLDDVKTTEEKLNCIKSLTGANKKIIIISNMHPLQVHEILNCDSDTNQVITNATTAKLIALILKNSAVIVLPLAENNYSTEIKEYCSKKEDIHKVMFLFLNQETKYTKFLKILRNAFMIQLEAIEYESQNFKEDKLILQIQSLAANFYMSIWRSLSADEKFVLYDFAADGLANINNTFAVSLLISKGLILEKEGHLHIFNKSFRNFIVSDVDDKEIRHLQILHNRHSNWSNLQTPLLLFVVAIFVFLAVAQEGLYSKVIGIISGVAAGIPALLKIISVFGTQTDKSSKKDQSE